MFSVDFSGTAIPESSLSRFVVKKLPLEALGSSVLSFLNFGQFCSKCRLGPPEFEHGSGLRVSFPRKVGKRG